MADYKETIDEWQKAVRRKARELDQKYSISEKVDDGARAAGEAAKRGARTFSTGAEKLRVEAERLAEDGDIADTARRTADEAVRGPCQITLQCVRRYVPRAPAATAQPHNSRSQCQPRVPCRWRSVGLPDT